MINSITTSLTYKSLEEFIVKFKEIFQKLKSDNIETDSKIADFKDASDNLIKSLENQKAFEEELFLYINIKDMLYYLFDEVGLLMDNVDFVNSLFNGFFHLLDLKLSNDKDYRSYLKEFELFLIKQRYLIYLENQ